MPHKRLCEADLVLVHSTLIGFYEQAGFERMDSLITLVGDPHRPERSSETAFLFFLSDKGNEAEAVFKTLLPRFPCLREHLVSWWHRFRSPMEESGTVPAKTRATLSGSQAGKERLPSAKFGWKNGLF